MIQTLTSTIYALGVPPQVTMVVKALVVFAVCIPQSPVWVKKARCTMKARLQARWPRPPFTAWVSVVLMFGLFGFGAASYTGFASPQVVYNLLIDNAFLLVIAVGMNFVILSAASIFGRLGARAHHHRRGLAAADGAVAG